MADPLSLLRQYNVNKRDIEQTGDYICFGEYCWPKTVKTNYIVYGSSRDGPNKEYYTLECLLFLLNNVNLPHPIYVKQAAAEGVPVVRRPDRKDLLSYLVGDTTSSNSIDRSAPLELPIPYTEALKLGADSQQTSSLTSSVSILHDEQDETIPNKIPRSDVMQKAKEQFSARLDEPKLSQFKKPLSTISGDSSLNDQSASASTTSLSEAVSIEKINALKAKRLAKKRSTIIDAENEFDKETNTTSGVVGSNILFKYDAGFTKEIQSKELVWRNRSTILQSTGKNFNKSIIPILQSIKNREEGVKKPVNQNNVINNNFSLVTPLQRQSMSITNPSLGQQQYNRYDQERFNRSDPAIGFKIDTTGSYHGLQLKNVTEGSALPKPMTGTPLHANSNSNSNHNSGQKPQKRVSRTPIIIITVTPTSLITMNNSKHILQDFKFVENRQAGDRKEVGVMIERKKPDNTIAMYRIIDNPLKLQDQDWSRVVAVFVQGPLWQFKGWPWQGNPVEIFARIKAFHLKFDEMKLDANVAKWNVTIIELSRNKRHLDRANLLKFWSILDQHMLKYHKHLKH